MSSSDRIDGGGRESGGQVMRDIGLASGFGDGPEATAVTGGGFVLFFSGIVALP